MKFDAVIEAAAKASIGIAGEDGEGVGHASVFVVSIGRRMVMVDPLCRRREGLRGPSRPRSYSKDNRGHQFWTADDDSV